jgi:hypothetical protein
MFYVLMALAGDCGTPYPYWWRHPGPPPPWWFLVDLVSAAGGILGGVMAQQIWDKPQLVPWMPLASLAAAFVAGRAFGAITTNILSAATVKAPALAREAA